MDVEEGADAVACAVQVIQSDLVEMLTGDYVDTGVVDSFREDETGQVDGSHKNSSVNVFFTSTGPAEMDSPRHIRRPVCNKIILICRLFNCSLSKYLNIGHRNRWWGKTNCLWDD